MVEVDHIEVSTATCCKLNALRTALTILYELNPFSGLVTSDSVASDDINMMLCCFFLLALKNEHCFIQTDIKELRTCC